MADWRDRAACADPTIPTEMFFPGPYDDIERAAALAFCGRCPVADECAEHAYALPERHGIWGGLTEADRSPTQGRGRPIAHGTARGYRQHLRRHEDACGACLAAHADTNAASAARNARILADAQRASTEAARRATADRAAGQMLDAIRSAAFAEADAQTKI